MNRCWKQAMWYISLIFSHSNIDLIKQKFLKACENSISGILSNKINQKFVYLINFL